MMILPFYFCILPMLYSVPALKKYFCSKRVLLRMTCEVFSPTSTISYPKSLILDELDVTKLNYKFAIYDPLIYHIKPSQSADNLIEMINKETGLPLNYIKELIAFGAVYLQKKRSKSKNKYHMSEDNVNTKPEMIRIETKMNLEYVKVDADNYCRVHANPRRYFGGYSVSWTEHIHMSKFLPNIILTDKPYDLAVSATIDNSRENLLAYVKSHLHDNQRNRTSQGITERGETEIQLFISSRLDACTSGLCPIPINSKTAGLLGKEISSRRVRKIYKLLCKSPKPLELRLIQHCFPNKRQIKNSKPTLLKEYDEELLKACEQSEYGADWQLAELRILSCNEVSKASINFEPLEEYELLKTEFKTQRSVSPELRAFLDERSSSYSDKYYECDVELITGRTHQIRLQFAALDAPILGDTRYEPSRGLLDEGPNTLWKNGLDVFGCEPRIIGLQCHQLTFTSEFIEQLAAFDLISDIDYEHTDMPQKIKSNRNEAGDLVVTAPAPWWNLSECNNNIQF